MISFLLLITFSNFVDATDIDYAVSFVAGQTGLGLVNITTSDKGIEVGQPSITQMSKILGSTAVLSVHGPGYWDYGFYYIVTVIHEGDKENPLKVSSFKYDYALKKVEDLGKVYTPGQYHPLHVFFYDYWSRGGGQGNRYLLTTGTFGTTGANNYVSYLLDGHTRKRIFVNPDDRSHGSAAIALDGGLVSQMTLKGVNHIGQIGRLKNGKLVGTPSKWLNVNDFQGYSQSMSNPIESTGSRYLAYRNFKQPGTSNGKSKVMIQSIDSKTGRPKGSPRSITKLETALNVDAEKFQSIAISPNGELILYTAWNNVCKKQILFARKLANGSSLGNSRLVVGCRELERYPVGIYGINISDTSSPW